MDRIVMALMTEPTLEGAARSAGVSYTTVWRLMKDAGFLERIREARRDHIRRITARLQATAHESLECLAELQRNAETESVRLGAAKVILEQSLRAAETEDVHTRLDILEQALKSQKQRGTNDDRQDLSRAAGTTRNANGHAQ